MTRHPRVRRPFGVNLAGYFQSEKGLGEAVRTLRRSLSAAGVPLALHNVIDPQAENRDLPGLTFDPDRPYAVNVVNVNADSAEEVEKVSGIDFFLRRYNVGFWSWELSEFPREWCPAFRYFDEVWTPSRFCQEAVAGPSPVPVRCVPHSIAVPELRGVRRAAFGLPDDRFVFLFAFDYRSYLERKNPLALVEAFRRAFGDRSDVLLVLKTAHADHVPAERRRVEVAVTGAANIRLFDAVLSREDTYSLLASCDCFASLHRSEGFGLNLAEAMALGRPVLATAYSANAEFMTPANSLPVAYRLTPIERDSGPYQRGQLWAEADTEHAAALMRRAAADRDHARRLGEQARRDIAERFSPERIGARARGYLEALVARPPRTDGLVELALRQSKGGLSRLWWQVTRTHYGTPPKVLGRLKRALRKAG